VYTVANALNIGALYGIDDQSISQSINQSIVCYGAPHPTFRGA